MAAPPSASTDEGARELFLHGQTQYQEGRYRDALVAFEVAYRMSKRPAILRSIAYCHEKLGQLDEALVVLHQYRRLAPADKWESIDRAIRRIELQKVSTPVVEEEEEEAELEESEVVAATPPPVQPPPEPIYEAPPKWKIGAGPIVLYAVGGVSAVVGGVFAYNASRAREYAAMNCSTNDAIFCRDIANTHLKEDHLFSLLADSGFGLGGAAILGGTIWMIVDNSEPNPVSVTAGLNRIAIRGRF